MKLLSSITVFLQNVEDMARFGDIKKDGLLALLRLPSKGQEEEHLILEAVLKVGLQKCISMVDQLGMLVEIIYLRL